MCILYKKISEKMKKFQSWSCPTYLTKNRTKIRCKKKEKIKKVELICFVIEQGKTLMKK
jgi:hypothetical protein